MNNEPEKVIRIALDDYLSALKGRISSETLGKVEDELKRDIPNLLKDDKKRVEYNPNNSNQHAYILDPKHDVTVTRIKSEVL